MPLCTQSGQNFVVSEEEKLFLQKISPTFAGTTFSLPLPTICPEERMRIRVAHRNEQNLYHRNSDFSQKPLISLYSADNPCAVYSVEEWFSDDWEGLNYGREFDSTRPFFEQFYELSLAVPKPNFVQVQNENCPYSTGTGFCKNCYLINSSENCEDCYYSKLLQNCRNVVDSSYAYDSELLYECCNVRNCYNCIYISNSQNTSNSLFSDNLQGCAFCFLCTNLQNKKYYFQNKPLSPEEYKQKIAEFEGYQGHQKALTLLTQMRRERIHKYANIINSPQCSGDFIRNSTNCINCYDMSDSQDCQHVQVGVQCKDLLDCSNMYIRPELCYNVMSSIGIYNVHFSLHIFHSSDVWYSEHCHASKHLFGCSGLRNKEYCIFNMQYSKEEYEQKVAQIITQMQQTQEWGQMFPIQNSLFAYNETLAQEYLPLSQEEVRSRNWKWKEEGRNTSPNITKKISATKLPDTIPSVPNDVLQWAIIPLPAPQETTQPYKIQSGELQFYRQMNLPLPRLHPNTRHQRRMQLRNPRKLFERTCQKCHKKILSTYDPEQPEIIYCEECYLEAVYS